MRIFAFGKLVIAIAFNRRQATNDSNEEEPRTLSLRKAFAQKTKRAGQPARFDQHPASAQQQPACRRH
jgi:hypothetical protein